MSREHQRGETMQFGRRRRRHPIDVVYDMMVLCKDGISPTKLCSHLGLQYTAFQPIVKEMVKLGLLSDDPSARPEVGPTRWDSIKMSKPKNHALVSGAPSDDGYFHRYKTLEKGHQFIIHYEALAALIGERIESPA